jgi:hypothetical protein
MINKKCIVCSKKFVARQKNNIICSNNACKKERQYLFIRKYQKSKKGIEKTRKLSKKHYYENRVILKETKLINGVYVKKYSNGKIDIKITLFRKCFKRDCENTFYAIANEGKRVDKKFCSIRCSDNHGKKITLENLKFNNPKKYREIQIKQNKKRKGKRTVANMTKEQIENRNKTSKMYRQSKKDCPIFKAKRKIRNMIRELRTNYNIPKQERPKIKMFLMTKEELKNITNLHLDHIYALNCKNYSGLHVANNFQWLPSELNIKKSNMPFDDWKKLCKQNYKEYSKILKLHGLKFNREYITTPIKNLTNHKKYERISHD